MRRDFEGAVYWDELADRCGDISRAAGFQGAATFQGNMVCIYLLYVIPYIPVFYFNDLQICTVHVHALYIMLHREIRKGELRRHKNKEWQSYSDNSSGVGSGPSVAAMAAPLLAHRSHTHQRAMHA